MSVVASWKVKATALALMAASAPSPRQSTTKIIMSNDDGWAVTNIRAAYESLTAAGYEAIISSPANNESGTSSLTGTPSTVGSDGCEFDSCPAGSPPEGSDPDDSNINYVNSYPATAMSYGISTTAPAIWGSPPTIAIAGPNIGSNVGIVTIISGTIGATVAASNSNIPAIAFSGVSGSQASYTTLSNASDPNTIAAEFYASAATSFVTSFLNNVSGTAYTSYLPSGSALNVNYPAFPGGACTSPEDLTYVLTRMYDNPFGSYVTTCGSDTLPLDSDVIDSTSGCYASVSVFNTDDLKFDASAADQAAVLERLGTTENGGVFGCFSS